MMIKSKKNYQSIRLNRSHSLHIHPDERVFLESHGIVIRYKQQALEPTLLNQDNEPQIKLTTMESSMGLDWVAEYPNLRGVVGVGSSVTMAIKNLRLNSKFHLEAMKSLKMPIPTEFQ